MTPEYKDKSDRFLKAIARDVLLPPVDETLSQAAEEQLWAYAMGLLDPPERDQVMELIARNELAEKTLERIRQTIMSPAEAISVLERAKRAMAAVGRDFSSVAAVIVRVGDGLVSALDQATTGSRPLAPEPVMMGESKEEQLESKKAVQKQIEIPGTQGLNATAILRPSGHINIFVKTSDPTLEGKRVKLVRLVSDETGVERVELIDDARVTNGKAEIEDCPEGVFIILAPDGREIIIVVEPGRP